MRKIYYLAAAALSLCACQKEVNEKGASIETREITVSTTLTKTGIAYEGDVSHLVWKEGDQVSYITSDAAGLGSGFGLATVKDNKFKATISAQATSKDKFLAVWGGSATEGASSIEIPMSTVIDANSTAEFDGKLLPMVALANVPDDKAAEIDVDFTPLAAVLRVSVDTVGHSNEKLSGITLTTDGKCIGTYSVSTTYEKGYKFTGTSNTVSATFPDTPLLKDFKYAYLVLAKGSYTGVRMEITTDKNTYTLSDGAMDLTASDRGLYRINVQLSEPPAPVEQKFVKVTEQSQIVAGGTYLIVSENTESSYYVAINSDSDGYLECKTINCDAEGCIEKTDEIMNYSVTLEDGTNSFTGRYAIKMSGLGSKPYLKAPGNVSEAVSYVGKFWYGNVVTTTMSNFFWGITVTDGTVLISSHEFKIAGEPTGRTGGIGFFTGKKNFGVFAPESEDYKPAQLLRLQ